jgi:hypothetical protein
VLEKREALIAPSSFSGSPSASLRAGFRFALDHTSIFFALLRDFLLGYPILTPADFWARHG